jgi:hypothetical protein
MRRELIANRALARHGIKVAIAAITIDAAYTTCFWLILGRNERRTKRYAELRYFAIIGQLSLETAVIIHLVGELRKVPADVAEVTELRAA